MRRWPANTLFDEQAAEILDKQSGISKSTSTPRKMQIMTSKDCNGGAYGNSEKKFFGHDGFSYGFNDSGGASRFFYCAKASSAERNKGCHDLSLKPKGSSDGDNVDNTLKGPGNMLHPDKNSLNKNFHPTVKPLKLMQYLIKLIAPPKDPFILDPFLGSGSTLVAAKSLGMSGVGIEINEEYLKIAEARIKEYCD